MIRKSLSEKYIMKRKKKILSWSRNNGKEKNFLKWSDKYLRWVKKSNVWIKGIVEEEKYKVREQNKYWNSVSQEKL